MDEKKRSKTKEKRLRNRVKHKSYQEFIDEIAERLKEKKEIEELYKRVIILKADDVLKEMEIKERNNKILTGLHNERKRDKSDG
jgi:predicted ATP-dependent Lon-type protease